MNLKSVAMASGLVLTFAAGAWLSTIMLSPPQRSNRATVQEQLPASSPNPQPPMARLPQSLPERLPDTAASNAILPPLPPLPPTPAAPPPAPTTVAEAPPAEPPVPVTPAPEPEPQAEQAAQPLEPPPPAVAEALQPALQPGPMAEAAPEPTAPAIPLVPPVETPPEADIDPGIAALSDLVARAPSASPPPSLPHRASVPDPLQFAPPPLPPSLDAASRSPVPPPPPMAPPAGPYFTIQVGSFQDPSNAASLVRSLGLKGWEAFVVDWANSTGHIWKVVRVGRYKTEAQAVSASAELTSAANLRGNVIKVR